MKSWMTGNQLPSDSQLLWYAVGIFLSEISVTIIVLGSSESFSC